MSSPLIAHSARSKLKSCLQPWSRMGANDRVIGYVQLHNQIHDFTGNNFYEGDKLVETSEYPIRGAAKAVKSK